MKPIATVLTIAALVLGLSAASAPPAQADRSGALVAGIVAGVVVGAIIANQRHHRRHYAYRGYSPASYGGCYWRRGYRYCN